MEVRMSMTVREAEAVVMPFGRHKRKTLGEIADEDLLYLDWARDKAETIRLAEAIATICEARKTEIDDLLEAKDAEQREHQFRRECGDGFRHRPAGVRRKSRWYR
jgi:DNA-binding Xre family transcriptional regulator